MNGSGGNGSRPESNQGVIKIVVIFIALNGFVGMSALAWCLVTNTKPDATLLTSFVGLTASFGSFLGGMLVRTTPSSAVQDVKVTNEKKDPVPTKPTT